MHRITSFRNETDGLVQTPYVTGKLREGKGPSHQLPTGIRPQLYLPSGSAPTSQIRGSEYKERRYPAAPDSTVNQPSNPGLLDAGAMVLQGWR